MFLKALVCLWAGSVVIAGASPLAQARTLDAVLDAAASGQTLTVPAGGNLQAAINAAQPGDTILLQAGATFVGNFVLPAKSGSEYITIRSSAADALLPPPGARITPAHAHLLPKLRSPNTVAALATAPGAHHYRLMFLEFMANANGAGNIINLGDGSNKQNSLASVPYELVLDRVYVRGDATMGQKRGVALNSASTSIVNSYFADIKAVGQDSQAICGWNGPGPYLIANNYLEAAGENVLFGGADPAIPGLVPSDITIVRNHFSKPLAWRGSSWQVKNLFELKSAQRVLVDGNLFEYNWKAAQAGYAILLKSVNQDGGAPWSVVQHVTFSNNIVRHVASAINILGRDTKFAAVEANHLTFRNNLFENVSASAFGGDGRFALINGGAFITFDHNTAITQGSTTLYADGLASAGLVFTNNVMLDNQFGIKGGGTGTGTPTLTKYFPGAHVVGNIIAGANAATYPAANFYPPLAQVGFANFAGGDYRLAGSSPYRGAATDGTDPGVDFGALHAAQAMAPPPPVPHSGGGAASHVAVPPAGSTASGSGVSSSAAVGASATATAAAVPSAAPAGAAASSAPRNLRASVTGSTVTISWTAPDAGDAVASYLLEAGTAPGATNAAMVNTGSPATSVVSTGVPNGVYYVRIRALTARGPGPASPELAVGVGTPAAASNAVQCGTAPPRPADLRATVSGSGVTLTWSAPAGGCAPSQYVVLAGGAPGLSNLAQATVPGTSFGAAAPPGTYYVRVVAVNASGASAPSNEVVVTIR